MTDSQSVMDSPLAIVTCSWGPASTDAVIVHSAPHMLVLEATDSSAALPEVGTQIQVTGGNLNLSGRLAEHGRGGRFLLSLGDRPVRQSLRLPVCLPATLRSPALEGPVEVEIMDLTSSGARLRGAELALDTQVTLDFVPPGRTDVVTVRATVVHGRLGSHQPWIGVRFRLVALRGGR